jgi:biopolymer transport protein ExbD
VSSVLMVDIDAHGVWSANGNPLGDHSDLIRIARESLARDPDVRAIVRADRSVAWGSVISAIDQLKQGGIARLAFAVSPLPAP